MPVRESTMKTSKGRAPAGPSTGATRSAGAAPAGPAAGGPAPAAEARRLEEDARRERNWKRWGPYLSERQWGTVREDYSADGSCWDYFPHDHARSRAYRWGEDGLLGITDRECRLCFALALWNGRDPILKERLFGLTGPEGNHGEDVKEAYFYLDSTPSHSYMKALYKYPQAEFPYARLVDENRRLGKTDPEFELADAGAFDGGRYFDVVAEYAKASPDDILIRATVANREPETAVLHVAEHATLGRYRLAVAPLRGLPAPDILFTENETNVERLFAAPNPVPHVKDAFHESIVRGRREAAAREGPGTKAAAHFPLEVPAGAEVTLRLRLTAEGEASAAPFGPGFEATFAARRPGARAGTPTGPTSSTATSSRCPTSGSTPGTPPGTWRST